MTVGDTGPPVRIGKSLVKRLGRSPTNIDNVNAYLTALACLKNRFNIRGTFRPQYPSTVFPKSRKPIVPSINNVAKKEDLPSPQEITTPPDSPAQLEVVVGGGGSSGGVAAAAGPPRGDWGPTETSLWLQVNRYTGLHSLSSYSGADLLRLSRDDLLQLCGVSEGIRLYNALHVRPVSPKLTLYVCVDQRERVYRAVYLSRLAPAELLHKVCLALGLPLAHVAGLFLLGPADIKVLPTDELVSHLPDNTAYTVQLITDGQDKFQMLLKQADITNQQA